MGIIENERNGCALERPNTVTLNSRHISKMEKQSKSI
jgi:hypothetical protein